MLYVKLSNNMIYFFFFFFSSRRRHTRSLRDWSSDVCSSDLQYLESDYFTEVHARFFARVDRDIVRCTYVGLVRWIHGIRRPARYMVELGVRTQTRNRSRHGKQRGFQSFDLSLASGTRVHRSVHGRLADRVE